MARKWMHEALKYLPLPDSVLDLMFEHLGRDVVDPICVNRNIGTYAVKLMAHKIGAHAMRELAWRTEPTIVAAILATRERRDKVLATLMHSWDLPEAEQLLLASRALSPSIAKDFLQDARYCDEAKAIASKRADPDVAAAWLLQSSLSDQSLFDAFTARLAKDPNGLEYELLALLVIRPNLRSLAVSSEFDMLKNVACWVEITDRNDQQILAEYALATATDAPNRPLIGLLGQASLDPALRARLWTHLGQATPLGSETVIGLVHLYQHGTPAPTSPLWPTGAVSDVTDATQLEMLASYAMLNQSSWSVRYRQVSLLSELAANAHVTEELRFRLLAQTMLLREATRGALKVAMDQTIGALSEALANDVASTRTVINKLGYAYSYNQDLRSQEAAAEQRARLSELDAPVNRSGYATRRLASVPENWTIGTSLAGERTAQSVSLYNETQAIDLAAYLTTRLGDATTASSQHAWRYFVNMMDNAPRESTFEDLTESSNLMAHGA